MQISGGNNLLNAQKILERAGVTQKMKVGDFGCGSTALFTLTAAKLVGKDGLVYAVDILKSVLMTVEERVRTQNLGNIKTVWSNLEIYKAAKIPDNSLDFGFLINTLFQTKKDSEVVKEAARMIKPGGKLLVVDWKKIGVPFGPPIEVRVDPNEIRQAAKQIGLEEQEEFEVGPYHFGIMFLKK